MLGNSPAPHRSSHPDHALDRDVVRLWERVSLGEESIDLPLGIKDIARLFLDQIDILGQRIDCPA
ncbi:hypothetical protein [Labrys neptuniae]